MAVLVVVDEVVLLFQVKPAVSPVVLPVFLHQLATYAFSNQQNKEQLILLYIFFSGTY